MLKIFLFLLLVCLPAVSAKAQFVDFGRNKVQYSDFDWQILQTEHFQIYHSIEAKELAEIGAKFAEDAYKHLQQKFRHSLVDTVPLIFYASPLHFKQTNTTPGLIPDGVGGFFEFIKGRVVIPFEGSLNQFRHVIRHELTHVFMTSKIANSMRQHGKSIGTVPPLWFTEGLAEHYSTEWDTQADMVIKDAVMSGYIAGLSDWERFYGTFFMYKLGQRVLKYISENFGEEKVLMLMENFWMDESFSNVMDYTIGLNYEEFDNEFLYYLEKLYFPQIADHDNPSKVTENVHTESFAHKPAYYEGNGKKEIYYIGNQTGYTSIYKTSPGSRNDAELVIEGEKSDEFEEFHFFRTGMDVSSKGLLAFITQKGDADALHVLDTRSGDVVSSYSFDNIVGIGSPSWSNDGKRIVFPATDASGKNDLYVFDIRANDLKRLTNDFYDDRDPDFSPDGKTIVFASDRTSFGMEKSYNLFLYGVDDASINYLTVGKQIDHSPHFSEDGRKIAFTSNASGPQNIWIMDLGETFAVSSPNRGTNSIQGSRLPDYENLEMRQITNFLTAAFDPRWCGKDKLVFSAFEKGGIGIRMLNRAGVKFDSSKNIRKVHIASKGDNWIAQRTESKTKKNSLKYEKRFSFDIATTALTVDPVFGANTGGIVSLSDLLGNERYYFLVFNNSTGDAEFWKSFNIAISKISVEKRMNYSYGIFHLSGRKYDISNDLGTTFYERSFGGYVSLAYPLSFFRRLEMTVSLSQTIRNYEFYDNSRSLLLSNYLSYIRDNTLWGWMGPVDGERLNVTIGYTTDIANSLTNYYSFFFDFRKYLRTGTPTTLALRSQLFLNEGRDARRFFMGGSWSLRGWPLNSIRGSKMWQANAEFRFPLLNIVAMRFPFGIGFDFPGIKGAVYMDAGKAWDRSYSGRMTYGSIGAGVRMTVFGLVVLRYDFGKRIEEDFTKLQGDLYHNLYFGFDF